MKQLPDKELLRVDEAASWYGVTDRTIYLWIAHGKLEAIRTPGGGIRISRKSVEECNLVKVNNV